MPGIPAERTGTIKLKNRIVADKNLSALEPALVWKHFAEIVRIPRPSSHEEKIRKYVMDSPSPGA